MPDERDERDERQWQDPFTDLPEIACWTCVHHLRDNLCIAFPDGIPDPIMEGKCDHRTPYDGDGGVQYLSQEDAERREAAGEYDEF